MSSLIVFGGICISAVVIFIIVLLIIKVSEDKNIEKELEEIIEMCSKLERDKSDKGIGVFVPPQEESYLYDILVKRKIMSRNPIGGYSFSHQARKLYEKYGIDPNTVSVVGVKNYEDDNGILKEGIDKKGNQIIITEEDIKKEKNKNES